jgi:hypothetical protein
LFQIAWGARGKQRAFGLAGRDVRHLGLCLPARDKGPSGTACSEIVTSNRLIPALPADEIVRIAE